MLALSVYNGVLLVEGWGGGGRGVLVWGRRWGGGGGGGEKYLKRCLVLTW